MDSGPRRETQRPGEGRRRRAGRRACLMIEGMGRYLYGPQELQERLRVSRQRVQQLIQRPDFPEPYDRLAMGTVWRISDVEAWIKKYRPHLNESDEE